MEKLDKIFFDPIAHKYTDEYGNTYTSMTTCIKKYTEEFKARDIAKACERIGKNPNHPKYLKYKGKSVKQLLYEWDKTSKEACEKGTDKHNYLENIINNANKFVSSVKKYSGNRIYTIQDIMIDHDFGRIDLSYFEASGLPEKYPTIFALILSLHKKGYKFYAEIGVFDINRLISGLIDLLAVHHESGVFFIIDWKTNKSPIMFKSGFFEKDNEGNITTKFIERDNMFYPPIDNVPDSIGHKYSLQVSGYAALVELFGLKNKGNIICHIRDTEEGEVVNLVKAVDLKNEAILMFNDFSYNNKINSQKRIFL